MHRLALIAFCIVSTVATAVAFNANDAQHELTTGTHFRVGFIHPDRAPGEPPGNNGYCVVIHAQQQATVRVGTQNLVVDPGKPEVICLPQIDVVEISSNRPISVTTYQDMLGNGEQSWHLPTSAWGLRYRAFSWWTDRHGLDSASMQYSTGKRLVIANEDETRVTVESAGELRDTVLNAGEFWLVSEVTDTTRLRTAASDPTGLAITANKLIGVIAGHSKAAVLAYPDGLPMTGPYARAANRCRGNLQDAMLPETMAGTEFVTVPVRYTPTRERGLDLSNQGIGDDRGDVVRFIAFHDSTVISRVLEDGNLQTDTIIDAGQTYSVLRAETATVWRSSRPVHVAQYGKSYGRITSQATLPEDDPTTDAGMPVMMMVPPVDRWVSQAMIQARPDLFNVVAVAVRSVDVQHLRFQNKPITSVARPAVIQGTPYSMLSVIVPAGSFTITADSAKRFACWTYGSLDGFQLGKIYGSAASVDVRRDCADSIDLTYDLDTASGQIIVNASMAWKTDTCSSLAMLYVDNDVSDLQWQRNGPFILIRRSSPNASVRCTVVAVSTSGRRDTLMIEEAITSIAQNGVLSEPVSVHPNPIGDVTSVTNLAGLTGRRLSIQSLCGNEVYSSLIESDAMSISTAAFTPGVYVLAVGRYLRMFVKL